MMYQRRHYHYSFYYGIATAIILWMLPAVIALPILPNERSTSLCMSSKKNDSHRPWIVSLSILFLGGPVLPAEATPSFLPTPITQQPQQQRTAFQQRPTNKLLVRRQEEGLQDDRLSQCRDKGFQWEQCFFYGTDTVAANHRGEFLRARPSSSEGGPPSW